MLQTHKKIIYSSKKLFSIANKLGQLNKQCEEQEIANNPEAKMPRLALLCNKAFYDYRKIESASCKAGDSRKFYIKMQVDNSKNT